MEFVFTVMFIISFVAVLIISCRVIHLMQKLANSRYRSCDVYVSLNEDQFETLMYVLNEITRMN